MLKRFEKRIKKKEIFTESSRDVFGKNQLKLRKSR
jgi:hypothetical protein